MAIHSVTQTIIDKIKRQATVGTDTDTAIAYKIGDTFDDIYNDTGVELEFIDETSFEITPSLAGIENGSYRLAIFYKVKAFYLVKAKETATAKAVRVKSGRDEVDTTKAVGGYENSIIDNEKDYKKCVNKINSLLGPRAIDISESDVI